MIRISKKTTCKNIQVTQANCTSRKLNWLGDYAEWLADVSRLTNTNICPQSVRDLVRLFLNLWQWKMEEWKKYFFWWYYPVLTIWFVCYKNNKRGWFWREFVDIFYPFESVFVRFTSRYVKHYQKRLGISEYTGKLKTSWPPELPSCRDP